MDYRNAVKWYQWDPTKWFIYLMHLLGQATDLHVFSDNEVRKAALSMKLKKLKSEQHDVIAWPKTASELPVVTWDTCEFPSKSRNIH